MINFLEITRSRLRNKILLYFYTDPDNELYLREISAMLDEDPGNLSKEMSRFEKEGIFLSQFRGKQKYFSLNKDYTLYDELKSIIFKTIGIKGSIQKIISEADGIVTAFIYGSYASGEESSASDVDLCIIIDDDIFDENKFISKISDLEKSIYREVNYIYYSRDERKNKISQKDSFTENMKDGQKIILKGDDLGL
jgi:predicted nucleotidyltransferase/predicted transcriptional regulator with HTH domain